MQMPKNFTQNPNQKDGQPAYYPYVYLPPYMQPPHMNQNQNPNTSASYSQNVTNPNFSNPNLLKPISFSNFPRNMIPTGNEKETIEFLQMKINILNLETENNALKEKINEIESGGDGNAEVTGNTTKVKKGIKQDSQKKSKEETQVNDVNEEDEEAKEIEERKMKEEALEIDRHKDVEIERSKEAAIIDLNKRVTDLLLI